MLDFLKKNSLFANLKKCRFYKDKICFLKYVILTQSIKIENKQIKTVKNWLEMNLI